MEQVNVCETTKLLINDDKIGNIIDNKKKLKAIYKAMFESNKNRIDELERSYNPSFCEFTKKYPSSIICHVLSLGFTAAMILYLIRQDKKEFKEQLDIWKSLNEYQSNL